MHPSTTPTRGRKAAQGEARRGHCERLNGPAPRGAHSSAAASLGHSLPAMDASSAGVSEVPHEAHAQARVIKLFRCVGEGDEELAEALLRRIGDADVEDAKGRTALCNAAAQGAANTARLLLQGIAAETKHGRGIPGANPNHADHQGLAPLHFACAAGHAELAGVLLDNGADIDAVDGAGGTPLTHACDALSTTCVDLLLERGANPKRAPGKPEHNTPLLALASVDHAAAEKAFGSAEKVHRLVDDIVRRLFATDIDPNDADSDGNTPLHHAVSRGKAALVKTLSRQEGVLLSPFNNAGQTPLHVAAFLGDRTVVTLMIDAVSRGVEELSIRTPGMEEVQKAKTPKTPNDASAQSGGEQPKKKLKKKRTLLGDVPAPAPPGEAAAPAKQEPPPPPPPPPPGAGITPLHCACLAGRDIAAKLLLNNGARAGSQDLLLRSPLYFAAFCGHAEIVRLLLTRQGNAASPVQIDGADAAGRTPLHAAAFMARDDVVHILADANANLALGDNEGRTALHLAAAAGNTSTCEALLEHPRSETCQLATVADVDGRLASHLAAAQGHAETLETILDFGAAADAPVNKLANAASASGSTPLHAAAAAGATECVAVLLARNAPPSSMDAEGRTPLHLAARVGIAETVALLVEGVGALPKSKGRSPSPVNVLAALDAAEATEGYTALHVAARHGHVACAKLLFDSSANINAPTAKQLVTPLHIAAMHGQAQMALFLAQCGADVSNFDYAGRTPLHCAAYFGHTLCGLALVRMGASLTARDNGGNTPVTAAVLGGYRELARALEEESRRPDAEGVASRAASRVGGARV